jgi:hexokinase
MSVHHENLGVVRPVERMEDPPELEYSAVRNDSLAMFGSAIGGAILGMLLTLLVLAIINGGTLSFTGGQRLDVLEASVTRIDQNVGAVSYNVDIVADQARNIQSQLVSVESALRTEMATETESRVALQAAVDTLSQTSNQFSAFLIALDEALSQAEIRSAPATEAAGD